MRLHRPHIPFAVRIKVAQRQLRDFRTELTRGERERTEVFLDRLLAHLAYCLTGKLFTPLQLDHDPALTNRIFSKRTKRYKPAANDPRFLIYRTTDGHDIKTRIRGDGAQLSDLALRRKNKRIEKLKAEGRRPKYGARA